MSRQKKQVLGSLISDSKKKYYGYLIIGIVLVLGSSLYWLRPFSAGHFSYPLKVSPELAASFGEVRKDHFHMGLDLRTRGQENLPVHAIADGFISRVQVSENGFGKALYVTHSNGVTSVYAHLNRFNDAIEKYIHQQQYQQEQWEQDLSFAKDKFPVKRGEIIARSGNTGTSEGPHLHLELRNTATGKSINPQTAGFIISDKVAPVIKNIYWYNKQRSIYETDATPMLFAAQSNKVIEVSSPRIILGIETYDKSAETRFRLGIYKSKLYMDDVLVHQFSMDELSCNNTGYVNASIDYKEYIASGKAIQLLATLPGNRLELFSKAPANGVLDLHDKQVHRIKIEIQDAAGNSSSIAFTVCFNSAKQRPILYPKNFGRIAPGRDTTLQQGQVRLHIPKNALFDSVPVSITTVNVPDKNAASLRVDISPIATPIYDSMEITIPSILSKEDRSRKPVVMLAQTCTGRVVIKGVWNNNKMTGKLPGFGTVRLVIDTTPPSISLVNTPGAQGDDVIRIVCKDNMGNIAAFRATLDGHWVVFERKGNVFTYLPDEYCKAGAHRLTVAATDIAGNITMQTFSIVR